MPTVDTVAIHQVTGIVEWMDVANREICVLVNGTHVFFDVPTSCVILLNDEPVKLRLLQPSDRVTVVYDVGFGGPITAHQIQARAGGATV